MKKLLVPTDFSENARHALQYAIDMALATGAKIEIAHANTMVAYAPVLPEYAYAGPAGFDSDNYEEYAADEIRKLKREFTDLRKYESLEFETRVEAGFVHTMLKKVATEDGCDLIVMGTKGASGLTEFFVGSNTEKVIRTAPCPVLAVPEGSGKFNLKTVVLATTLKPEQMPVFRLLAEWQKTFPFQVKVLYLNNPAGFRSETEIEAEQQKMCAEAGLQNAEVFATSNTFNEEMAILRFADEVGADLVAMATHQRQGISHLLFGSLTEDTANHSEIPVLAVSV